MATLTTDFRQFSRLFPAMPIRWIVLKYAERHLKTHRHIPPDMAFMLVYLMWAERKYSDSQPRVPAGSPDGGQWTSGGGGDSSGTDIIFDPLSAINGPVSQIFTSLEDQCDAQLEQDLITCRALASASCYAQAMQRFAACLRGKSLPPFNF
jgi:hypothetical protein